MFPKIQITLWLSILLITNCRSVYAEEPPNIYDAAADNAQSTPLRIASTDLAAELNKLPPEKRNCMSLCYTTFATPGPADRRKEEVQTCFAACYAKTLGNDSPEKESYRNLAMEHYANAKDLGSDFPPPTFP